MTTQAPREGQLPVLQALHNIGYHVRSLSELRESGQRYRDAVPILVAALQQGSDPRTMEELVRALSVPWASPTATGPLIELFRRLESTPELGLRWAVGNALEVVWDDQYFAELESLATDRSSGRARQMIVLGLARSRRPEASAALIDVLDDEAVNGHAAKALRKLKDPAARPGLERLLLDKRTWVRKEAKAALRALE